MTAKPTHTLSSLRGLAILVVVAVITAACGAGNGDTAGEATDGTAAPETETAEGTSTEEATTDGTPTPLDPPEEVRIAYVPIMKFATSYVAQGRGLFDKYGLDVQFEQIESGTEAIAFLNQGSVDVGGIALVASTWNAWAEGSDMRVIAPGGLEPQQDSPTQFLVRDDLADSGEIEGPGDLAGNTVAVAGGPGSGGEYLVSKVLEEGGLTLDDVQIERLGNPDMPVALENDSIDAALLGSPYAEQVVSDGHAVELMNMAEIVPGLMTVAFVASGDFVNNRPEVAERFGLALTEAARQMQGDDYLAQENIDAYLEHVDTTEQDLREGVPVIYDPDQMIPVEGLSDIEQVHRQNGRVEYEEPMDIDQIVDTSLTENARQVLGTVEDGSG